MVWIVSTINIEWDLSDDIRVGNGYQANNTKIKQHLEVKIRSTIIIYNKIQACVHSFIIALWLLNNIQMYKNAISNTTISGNAAYTKCY